MNCEQLSILKVDRDTKVKATSAWEHAGIHTLIETAVAAAHLGVCA